MVPTSCYQLVRMRLQKRHLPVLLSPEKVTAGSCLQPHQDQQMGLLLSYSLGTLQIISAVEFRMSGWACEPFMSRFVVLYSSMVSLDLILVDFQNQVFWELVFLMSDTRVRMPEVRHSPFTLQGKALYFGAPLLIVGHCTSGRIQREIESLPLLPVSMYLFYLLLGRCC